MDIKIVSSNKDQVKNCSLPIIESSLSSTSNKNIKNLEKEKSLRKITETKKWKLEDKDFLFENQIAILQDIIKNDLFKSQETGVHILFKSEIQHKIASYRSQDLIKNLFHPESFVDFPFAIQLLNESQLNCFYCRKKVQIFYKNVREPLQWSLERIDNNFGHNKDNVVIACLNCNLRRRTMYHERFIFTKQLNIVKLS